MKYTISNTDDVIDSRDVIAAIDELEQAVADLAPGEQLEESLANDFTAFKALRDEASQYARDWEYGEMLIRDDYFETYAKELAKECYTLPDTWPHRHIDWAAAAEELKQDYTAVDFGGVTYWVR